MVRSTGVDILNTAPRPFVVLGNDYPNGHEIVSHKHRHGQFIYGQTGTVVLATPEGTWAMPPQRGLWIPVGVVHDVRMVGAVSLCSLFLDAGMAARLAGQCQVLEVTSLMRVLMSEAMDLPANYDVDGRGGALMNLLHHELATLRQVPLALPLPTHAALALRCRRFLARPSAHETIDAWGDDLGMSRRAFTRLFRRETGLSFVDWRQQACLVVAVPRLAAGEPVTTVALDLGYDNPAAFTTMFRRVLGSSPRSYFQRIGTSS